ncbi:MAG: TatD family hydrolase, partial [Bacteroidales bacterium]|nr:TatD family hydrolase [Bacteroidales bacterium]
MDTHTHFYDEWLLPDAEEAVGRALDAGVGKMIQADVDSRERPAMWEIGKRHPGVLFQMLGLYPGSVGADWREELDQVFAIAKEKMTAPARSEATQGVRGIRPPVGETSPKTNAPAFVAMGEIGLDYHEGLEFVEEQKEALRLQLELASALNLPVNIHLRDAWEDFFGVLSDCVHLHLRGNLHCFTSSYE